MTAREFDRIARKVETIRIRHGLRERQRLDGKSQKINENRYKIKNNLDIISACDIIKMRRGFRGDDEGPDAWITTESGAHIPLDKNGVAMGGAGGWAKGKDFSSAKGSAAKGTAAKLKTGMPSPKKGDLELIKKTEDDVASTKANLEDIINQNHESWNKCREAYENGEKIPSGGKAEKDSTLKSSSRDAQDAYDKARASEPKITSDLVEIASKSGTEMYGLDFSVKTASSVEDKIDRKMKDYSKAGITKSDAQVVKEMGDLVRYTQMCDHDKIAETAKSTLAALKNKGYEITEVDNKWMDKGSTYKGLHISAKDKNGQTFELQIHSPESMMVKEQNHVQYEVARNTGTSQFVKEHLNEEMRKRTAGMRMPKGMDDPALKSWKKGA